MSLPKEWRLTEDEMRGGRDHFTPDELRVAHDASIKTARAALKWVLTLGDGVGPEHNAYYAIVDGVEAKLAELEKEA